jgi:hypothetical protein
LVSPVVSHVATWGKILGSLHAATLGIGNHCFGLANVIGGKAKGCGRDCPISTPLVPLGGSAVLLWHAKLLLTQAKPQSAALHRRQPQKGVAVALAESAQGGEPVNDARI